MGKISVNQGSVHMKYAPIALFTYNRPSHTRQTVEALLKNPEARYSDLILFSDGPKDDASGKQVQEVRRYLHNIEGFKSIRIVERDTNFGLADSIISGVSEVVDEYGRVIVLEDDLITTPGYLCYMNQALNRYEGDKRVMQISGHMFDVDIKAETDAVFLPFTTSWGWATWKRAWVHFDPSMAGYERLRKDRKLRWSFNLDGAYDYFGMLKAQKKGRIDSWAIRWYLSVFLRHGLVLFPVKSFVKNIGFDDSGTHCRASSSKAQTRLWIDYVGEVENFPCVSLDNEAYGKIKKYLYSEFSFKTKVKFMLNRFRCIP